jgi:hypothetical protein
MQALDAVEILRRSFVFRALTEEQRLISWLLRAGIPLERQALCLGVSEGTMRRKIRLFHRRLEELWAAETAPDDQPSKRAPSRHRPAEAST